MLAYLEGILWSGPLLVLLMGSHIYFTGALRWVQRYTLRGIRLSLRGGRDSAGVSTFGALSTSLAAAIGTGNIIGVATAVALGGPGAVFWCWLTGVLGMATRYAETAICLRHRRNSPDGAAVGGPMYVMEDVLGLRWLGRAFAAIGAAAAVGTGAMIQANAAGEALCAAFHLPRPVTGLVIVLAAGAILRGGAGAVSRSSEKLVPGMCGLYLLGCLGVLVRCHETVLPALLTICKAAFLPQAAAGGFVGSTILTAARYGTARGLFTNEAGMGSAPLAASAGPAWDVRAEALAAMTGVFWDTVVICTLTGLSLVAAMLKFPALFQGASAGQLCFLAFSCVPGGQLVLTVSLAVFAFATVVGWSWYGACCWRYLGGRRGIYGAAYLFAAFLGTLLRLETVWSLGSILSGLMTVPNLTMLFLLRREIRALGPEDFPSAAENSCFSLKKRYNGGGSKPPSGGTPLAAEKGKSL